MRLALRASWLFIVAACTFDWDAYDPRRGDPPAMEGGGGAGGGDANACGDGSVGGDEECDDGGAKSGDGCSDACTVECDGLLDPQSLHCYSLLETALDWSAARRGCAELGAGFDLAAISSLDEQDFLNGQTAITERLLPDLNAAVVWLGGSDALTEGEWVWANGEPFLPLWAADEPNNDGINGEDCAVYLLRDGVYSYDDRPCDEIYTSLCERAPAR